MKCPKCGKQVSSVYREAHSNFHNLERVQARKRRKSLRRMGLQLLNASIPDTLLVPLPPIEKDKE